MKRVVITGVGVVAPGGTGREAFWDTISQGKSACDVITMIAHVERFRSQMAAEVKDWPYAASGLTNEDMARLDRHIQFALVAATEAWQDADIGPLAVDSRRLGVSAGTAIGSSIWLEQEYLVLSNHAQTLDIDPGLASPYLFKAVNPSSLSAEVAAKFGARGPVLTVSSGCTAGVDAIAQGFEWIQFGDADVVIAGASEAGICPINMASFDAIKATSPRNDMPRNASRPFEVTRNGFVLGEGSAFLVLEEREFALKRSAYIYAEITGYGSALNAYHMTGLPRNGLDMVQAIHAALTMAGIELDEVDYINAHGSSTPQNDLHETNAFKAVWGEQAYHIPISSIKSMVGHSLGAIGAIELAACALIIQRGIVPPTINYELADPQCDLDYIPNTARILPVTTLLSTASGFGGFQSAMVLSQDKENSYV